jgi:hypothetical protein
MAWVPVSPTSSQNINCISQNEYFFHMRGIAFERFLYFLPENFGGVDVELLTFLPVDSDQLLC